jgi:hypothetical protein
MITRNKSEIFTTNRGLKMYFFAFGGKEDVGTANLFKRGRLSAGRNAM